MGRQRTFDLGVVVRRAADAFRRTGYVGTSVDDLLRATGLQRASLYHAFGSKRGLFVAVLRDGVELDDELLLIALMDLAADDDEIRDLAVRALGVRERPAETLGAALLARARVEPARLRKAVPPDGAATRTGTASGADLERN